MNEPFWRGVFPAITTQFTRDQSIDLEATARHADALIESGVAGSGIAFPRENQYFWQLTRDGAWEKAREFYRWFTPLLHLDTSPKFIQYIKLAVQECGLGQEWVRAPRLPPAGAERDRILQIIHHGLATRPQISNPERT
jgi:4-hydroxy-tetrahydrodipicolinate synthase